MSAIIFFIRRERLATVTSENIPPVVTKRTFFTATSSSSDTSSDGQNSEAVTRTPRPVSAGSEKDGCSDGQDILG